MLLWPAESDRADIQMMTDVHYQNEILMFCIENPHLFPRDPDFSSDDNILSENVGGSRISSLENASHIAQNNAESNSNLTQVTDEGQFSGSNSEQTTPPAQSKQSQFQTPPGVNPAAQSALGPPTYSGNKQK